MKRKHSICKWKGILFALLWTVSLGTFAQTVTVRGTVVDDTGLTVIGASVVVESNRTIGTITDIDGKYGRMCHPEANLPSAIWGCKPKR